MRVSDLVESGSLSATIRTDSPMLHHISPGLREDYGDHYYAAFLVDPDGHRIEAVINDPRA